MTKKFIQVNAHKSNGDFSLCSNLSLMANGKSYDDAIRELHTMAADLTQEGYEIDWIIDDISGIELEMYSDLFAEK